MRDPISGAKVLVTGGARGMGELYVRRAISEGAQSVAIWDIDAPRAEDLAQKLSESGVPVTAYQVDISDLDSIRATAEKMRAAGEVPDVLINNAGIVRGAPFWEHDATRDIEATMRINALAPMWLTREFLPEMMADKSRPKRILNIASAAGTLSNPNMSVYAASKWALIGWGDSLRLELERSGEEHIKVTTFCPSYVSTGMFEGARGPLLTPILKPRAAAGAAWDGMRRGVPFVLRPWTVKLGMALRGVLPTKAWDRVASWMGVHASMDKFTGRNPEKD